jgi:hypothetical protein
MSTDHNADNDLNSYPFDDEFGDLDVHVRSIKDKRGEVFDVHCNVNKHSHHVINHQKRTDRVYLDVIAVVSNPVEFSSRYRLFQEFCSRMRREPQIRLTAIEVQHGNKPFSTDAKLKYRTADEVWHKENMINVAVASLPADWEYMAWVDADIEFQRKDWVAETSRQLQHYDIVQLFSHAIDLGPNGEAFETHTGFCYQWVKNPDNMEPKNNPYKKYWHTGYGFAIRKKMYNALGGLIEFPILGAADHHMCKAWIGRVENSFPGKIHQNYKTLCMNYQERCTRHLKHNIGYVPGTIVHYWHGKKADRKYHDRWKILTQNEFDPLMDIKKDCNNLWTLEGNKPRFRDALRAYFRVRNEDSIDMEDRHL